MAKIFLRIFTVAFSFLLAIGWQWTNLLRTQEKITREQQIFIATLLTSIFLAQQVYLVLPKPVPKAVALGRRRVVETYLFQLMEDYYKLLRDSGDTIPNTPVIRINVMLPTLAVRGLLGKYIRMYYMQCPDGISYSGTEQELKWRKGKGLCGHTWKTQIATSFDAENNLDSTFFKFSKSNKKAIENIKSALSLPIWCKHELVGILNIDSALPMNETKLNNQTVRDLFEDYADRLGDLCFTEGVAG